MKIKKLRVLQSPKKFSGSENFSDGIGIIVLDDWSKRRPINQINEVKKTTDISDSRVIISPRGLGQEIWISEQFVIEGNDYSLIQENMNIILDELKNNPNFTFYDVDYKKTRPHLKST